MTQLLLFKDSNCDLCKVMQQQLMDNPPECNIAIMRARNNNDTLCEYYNIKEFPTAILIEVENNTEITRWTGFVSTETINETIKRYETEFMV